MILTLMLLLAQVPVHVPADEEPVAPYAQSNANAGANPDRDGSLFRAFHGQPGVDRVVDDFVARNTGDPRIGDIFKGQDLVRLHRMLKEHFCYLLGGDCPYTGRSMKDAHKDMGIQQPDMGALVENLQAAMRTEGVPFMAQNRLLAKLAPMKRAIVTR